MSEKSMLTLYTKRLQKKLKWETLNVLQTLIESETPSCNWSENETVGLSKKKEQRLKQNPKPSLK